MCAQSNGADSNLKAAMVWGPPVPEPIAPMKSAMMVSAPMHIPPKAAAVGM